MKTIAIHVGAHKTGSSLLQRILIHSQASLAQHGLYFDPEFQEFATKTFRNAYQMPESELEPYRQFYRDRYQSVPQERIAVSCEALMGNKAAGYDNLPGVVQNLAYLFQDFEVKIVGYSRRQDTYLESFYSHTVKTGGDGTFDHFMELHHLNHLHWDTLFTFFADKFGRDNLFCAPYEELMLDAKSFIQTFFDEMGFGGNIELENTPVINPGINRKGMELQRIANTLLNEEERKLLRAFLEAHFMKQPNEPFGLLSDEERRRILEYYRDSNMRFFRDFVSPRTKVSYLPE